MAAVLARGRPRVPAGAVVRALSALTMEKSTVGPVPAYVAGTTGAPAVIVLQEWWGVTPQIERHASKFVDAGYRVLIPDLYKGKVGVDAEEASHLMDGLDFSRAVIDVAAVAANLKSVERVPAVGVVGFCMGGVLALGTAAACRDVACAVSWYGVNFGLFSMQQLKEKPILAHFGEEDTLPIADPSAASKLDEGLRLFGHPASRVWTYTGVGHAFANDSPAPFATFQARREALGFPPFAAEQAAVAWGRTLDFCAEHLKAHD